MLVKLRTLKIRVFTFSGIPPCSTKMPLTTLLILLAAAATSNGQQNGNGRKKYVTCCFLMFDSNLFQRKKTQIVGKSNANLLYLKAESSSHTKCEYGHQYGYNFK